VVSGAESDERRRWGKAGDGGADESGDSSRAALAAATDSRAGSVGAAWEKRRSVGLRRTVRSSVGPESAAAPARFLVVPAAARFLVVRRRAAPKPGKTPGSSSEDDAVLSEGSVRAGVSIGSRRKARKGKAGREDKMRSWGDLYEWSQRRDGMEE
jgi:hypothetical protein